MGTDARACRDDAHVYTQVHVLCVDVKLFNVVVIAVSFLTGIHLSEV